MCAKTFVSALCRVLLLDEAPCLLLRCSLKTVYDVFRV